MRGGATSRRCTDRRPPAPWSCRQQMACSICSWSRARPATASKRTWRSTGMRRGALALLAHNLDGQRQLRILDAGCGTGGTTVELRRFGDVVGIDVAWEALEPARGRGLEQLAQASIEQLPFRDAAFD